MTSIESAKTALQNVQSLDSFRIVRRDDLGMLNFADAERPARATIELFKQIPISKLDTLPPQLLERVERLSGTFRQRFDQILLFRPGSLSNPQNERDSLANQLANEYPENFNSLAPVISFLQNLGPVDPQVRDTLQEANERVIEIERQAKEMLETARSALEDARRNSAQQGVSQQAYYFKVESKYHRLQAKVWGSYIRGLAITAIVLLILALGFYKWSWLSPDNAFQAVQLSLSKTLIISTIAYLLFLSARNFLAHKHNAVVNRHRQNALQTFEALVAAAGTEKRDIVLTHAAACIFSPQETGYTKASAQTNITGLVESVPRMINSAS